MSTVHKLALSIMIVAGASATMSVDANATPRVATQRGTIGDFIRANPFGV